MFYYGYYSYYYLILIGSLITLLAQMYVERTYYHYSRISSYSGYSGHEIARKILDQNGLYDVGVYEVRGKLSDHYDPSRRQVNLSSEVYHGKTISAIAIAAHECGHALQHKEGYRSLLIRNQLIPVFNFSQNIGWVVLMIGFLFEAMNIALLGVIILSLMLVFQLLTLPIEFNASKRAIHFLQNNCVTNEELVGSKKMLIAAALTYVASVAASVLSILRLFLIVLPRDRRD
mgnify:FL=1